MNFTSTFANTLVLATVGLQVPSIGFAQSASETCNRQTARLALKAGEYGTLCGCSQVTESFISRLQRASDFEQVLATTNDQCPALATLLTETVTASISDRNPFGTEPRNNDGGASGEAPGSEAPGGEAPGADGGGDTGGGDPDGGGDTGGEGEGGLSANGF